MRTFRVETMSPQMAGFLRGLSYLLPNFENFNVMGAAAHGRAVPGTLILQDTGYALLYSTLVLLMAIAVFARRNLK
jgi:hypothetical protein